MEFHISRGVRTQLDVDGLLFRSTGNVVFADVAASRRLASRLSELRQAQGHQEQVVHAGALYAMGMIDELNHALVAHYRKEVDPALHQEALKWFAGRIGAEGVEKLLLRFTERFPSVAVYQGKLTAAQWLAGASDGLTHREAALEELTMLWLANRNPAFAKFRELFDDGELKLETDYQALTESLPEFLNSRPPLDPEVGSLYEALTAPMLAAPDSVTAQLEFIRERWTPWLGEDLKRVLIAISTVKEEEIAIWMQFHPAGRDTLQHGAHGRSDHGFRGDEYVGFDEEFNREFVIGPDGQRLRRYAADYQAPLNEYEGFSADLAWMPNVVLVAKSTYVWLEQLSKKYGRHIHRLDQIPDDELETLADRGINGLWLIGLWERSIASRTIKRLRGQGDAVASAYSLKDYAIAEDLGGGQAYAVLRDRAARRGIRLASDMVPNHMGIDSDWVIEHPDWFLSRPQSPFPGYGFEGPDISPDSRVEIKIEDHYYDQTDAAVVFRLRHHVEGRTRFLYHGNDGTSFAWNDTAQLDYTKDYVREHVLQTILHVARMFPIIRFDAAMVLAKRHVQRLWFPLAGTTGAIPSRAEDALSQEQFDALMPNEFWREVVDRVAIEVPGTLLLAEAFWLLESYFVRTLGMHRVYNSAFMHMLRDEENAKYRSYLKKTMEFDPDILKRYVNFMSNPDERTAIDQFGDGDKYFGVCTLLATLPGLPMLGHGQVEGYGERYGMEFKQARMDESPNQGLIDRHMREIAPLLKRRPLFSESTAFALYDFVTDYGTVDENVYAYSNRLGNERALVFFNNRYGNTRGSIHISSEAMDKSSGRLRQTILAHALGLPQDGAVMVAWRDYAGGLEFLRRATDFYTYGLAIELRGFQHAVLLDWRLLRATAEAPWDTLCDALEGRGVPDLNQALARLRFRSVHEAMAAAVSPQNPDAPAGASDDKATGKAIARFVNASHAVFAEMHKVCGPELEAGFATVLAERQASHGKHRQGAGSVGPTSASIEPDPDTESASEIEALAHLDGPEAIFPMDPTGAETAAAAFPVLSLSASLSESGSAHEPAAESLAQEYLAHCASLFAAALRLPEIEKQLATLEQFHSRYTQRESIFAQLFLKKSCTSQYWLGHSNCETALSPVEARFTPPDAGSGTAPLPHAGSGSAPLSGPASASASGALLAWIVVAGIPVPALHPWLFDHLLLRPAMADIFSAMGAEAEESWRLSARVRILLRWRSLSAVKQAEFWLDPDVRWLAGVNQAEGVDYFRKEGLEELTGWLALPALVDLAAAEEARGVTSEASANPADDGAAGESNLDAGGIMAQRSQLDSAAKAAGYRLEDFLAQPTL